MQKPNQSSLAQDPEGTPGRQAHWLPHPCVHQLHTGHCPCTHCSPQDLSAHRKGGSPHWGRRKPAGSPRPGLNLTWPLASHVALGKGSGPEPQFPPLSSGERAPSSQAAVGVLSTRPTAGALTGPCLPAQPSLGSYASPKPTPVPAATPTPKAHKPLSFDLSSFCPGRKRRGLLPAGPSMSRLPTPLPPLTSVPRAEGVASAPAGSQGGGTPKVELVLDLRASLGEDPVVVGPGDSLKGHHPRAAILKSSGPWVAPDAQRPRPVFYVPQRVDADCLSLSPRPEPRLACHPGGGLFCPRGALEACGWGKSPRSVFSHQHRPGHPLGPRTTLFQPPDISLHGLCPRAGGGSIPASALMPPGQTRHWTCWRAACAVSSRPATCSLPSVPSLSSPPRWFLHRSQWLWGSRLGTHLAKSHPDPLGSPPLAQGSWVTGPSQEVSRGSAVPLWLPGPGEASVNGGHPPSQWGRTGGCLGVSPYGSVPTSHRYSGEQNKHPFRRAGSGGPETRQQWPPAEIIAGVWESRKGAGEVVSGEGHSPALEGAWAQSGGRIEGGGSLLWGCRDEAGETGGRLPGRSGRAEPAGLTWPSVQPPDLRGACLWPALPLCCVTVGKALPPLGQSVSSVPPPLLAERRVGDWASKPAMLPHEPPRWEPPPTAALQPRASHL